MTHGANAGVGIYSWIELAARSSAGRMVRNHFVHADDTKRIAQWRRLHSNQHVFASVCRFTVPERKGPAVCPCFFDIDAEGNLELARSDTLRLVDLLQKRIDVNPDSLEIHFSGAKGFHVIVPLVVFGVSDTPGLMPIWKEAAGWLHRDGVGHLDLGIYDHSRLLRLTNSRHGASGLHKIPLEFKELSDLGLNYVLELAREPRECDSMAVPSESPKAADWLAHIQTRLMQHQRGRRSRRTTITKKSCCAPPCIRRVETGTLPDGVRHSVYRAVARFYATTGMAREEAVERLGEIDQRNPIRDSDYIERMLDLAWKNGGFAGCPEDVLEGYCDRSRCPVAHQAPDRRLRGDAVRTPRPDSAPDDHPPDPHFPEKDSAAIQVGAPIELQDAIPMEDHVMSDSETRRPEASKRFDRVEAAIWRQQSENENAKSPFFTVTLSSNYRDAKGEWHRSNSFSVRDLPHLQLAVNWAMHELLLKPE